MLGCSRPSLYVPVTGALKVWSKGHLLPLAFRNIYYFSDKV